MPYRYGTFKSRKMLSKYIFKLQKTVTQKCGDTNETRNRFSSRRILLTARRADLCYQAHDPTFDLMTKTSLKERLLTRSSNPGCIELSCSFEYRLGRKPLSRTSQARQKIKNL